MIVVAYKGYSGGIVHIPCKRLDAAKIKANNLYKKGKKDVVVLEVSETIIYIPNKNCL